MLNDLISKTTTHFESTTTRGPIANAEACAARKEELAARGQAVEPDAEAGGVSVEKELGLLSELLLAPAAALLPKGCPLLIVPHLSLQCVPFCALPLPSEGGGERARLVDEHPITIAPSLTVHRHLVHTASKAAAAATPAPLSSSVVAGGAAPSPSFELPALPHASAEVAKVAAALGCEELSGPKATAKAVGLQLTEGTHRVVHLACHARPRCLALTPLVSDSARTMAQAARDAMDAALEMAATKGDDSAEAAAAAAEAKEIGEAAASATAEVEAAAALGPIGDGLIIMDALSDWPLKGSPTVMLTGSHGGTGHVSHDSTLALPRTLLCSGARAVVASTHEVADEPAALLSAAFYAALLEQPTLSQAAALQKAMLATRQADGGKWAHPAFWSGFALIGAAKGL